MKFNEIAERTREHYDNLCQAYVANGRLGLVAYMQSQGNPTDNAVAEALWHLLSGNNLGIIPRDQASSAYTECGYIPFSGFPLQRAK